MKRQKLHLVFGLFILTLSLNAKQVSNGTAFFNTIAASDCDTIIVNGTTVYADSSSIDTINAEVCEWSSYTFADGTVIEHITSDKTHISILSGQAADGCDSLVVENLERLSRALHAIHIETCQEDAYTF